MEVVGDLSRGGEDGRGAGKLRAVQTRSSQEAWPEMTVKRELSALQSRLGWRNV